MIRGMQYQVGAFPLTTKLTMTKKINMRVNEKYLISRLELLDLDSLVVLWFFLYIAWHYRKPLSSIPQVWQFEFSFLFQPP
jgi:hypothetical protein